MALVKMLSAIMKVIVINIIICFLYARSIFSIKFVKSISVICDCVIFFCKDYKKLIIEFLIPCCYVFILNKKKNYPEIVQSALDLFFSPTWCQNLGTMLIMCPMFLSLVFSNRTR